MPHQAIALQPSMKASGTLLKDASSFYASAMQHELKWETHGLRGAGDEWHQGRRVSDRLYQPCLLLLLVLAPPLLYLEDPSVSTRRLVPPMKPWMRGSECPLGMACQEEGVPLPLFSPLTLSSRPPPNVTDGPCILAMNEFAKWSISGCCT